MLHVLFPLIAAKNFFLQPNACGCGGQAALGKGAAEPDYRPDRRLTKKFACHLFRHNAYSLFDIHAKDKVIQPK